MKNKVLIVATISSIDWNRTIFDRTGLRILSAETVTTALKIHREEKADVIIAELGPPGAGADVLCERVRSDEDLRKASIIVITPVTPEEKARAASCGADAIIVKPYHPDQLLEKVGELLAVRNRRGYRVLVSVAVETSTSAETFISSSQNLSVTGMLLETSKKLDEGTRVTCSFTLPGARQVVVQGDVVRTFSFPGSASGFYGVRFLDLDDDSRRIIEEFIGESVIIA